MRSVQCFHVVHYRFRLVSFDFHPVHYLIFDAFYPHFRHHLFDEWAEKGSIYLSTMCAMRFKLLIMAQKYKLQSQIFVIYLDKPSSPEE